MKQKNQIILLAALIAAAGVVWYVARSKPPAPLRATSVAQNSQLLSVENPRLHLLEQEAARKTEYKGAGRNPFSTQAPPPVNDAKPTTPKPQPQGPPVDPIPPPPELPANMKFFGYGTVPNGTARRAFFTDGEDVYIVSEGELFLNRYRIVKVGNASLDFEEVSSGRHGTKALEEQGQGPSA